jgi:hypothetical protein
MHSDDDILIYPMPSLVATLRAAERSKGEPLTEEEVIGIRNEFPSVAVPRDIAQKIDEERGYKDIDPENAWEDWQEMRRHFAAK